MHVAIEQCTLITVESSPMIGPPASSTQIMALIKSLMTSYRFKDAMLTPYGINGHCVPHKCVMSELSYDKAYTVSKSYPPAHCILSP